MTSHSSLPSRIVTQAMLESGKPRLVELGAQRGRRDRVRAVEVGLELRAEVEPLLPLRPVGQLAARAEVHLAREHDDLPVLGEPLEQRLVGDVVAGPDLVVGLEAR